jgi:tetratricopeptide (TPR) repeat protein
VGTPRLSGDRYQGHLFNPADLAEAVDLDLERRKTILFTEARLAEWTHWQVLGLPWNASVEAVRAAYIDQVKIFHPDRYPGKKLGSFRGRLERVFRRVTEARDVLTGEPGRAAYVLATAPALERTRIEARRLEDERRASERRGRLARHNPLLARAERINELMTHGRDMMASGNFAQAGNDFQLVASLDPGHAEAAALAAEARKKATAARVAECIDKGHAAEAMGSWQGALAAYRAALEVDPANTRGLILASRAAVEVGDVVAAREFAEHAVRVQPRNAPAHEALGAALDAAGKRSEAKKALERAVEIDPRLESARERLKKLRWSFLG